MSQLPLRLKLTLAFAAVMAVVLVGTGLFLYLRLGAVLDESVNQGLRSRAADVSALVQQADAGLTEAGRSPLTEQGESFAQILERDGTVLDATPQLRSKPLVMGKELQAGRAGTIMVERDSPFERGEPVRLLATPVQAQGRDLVVVVGASTEENQEALDSLALLLALGGPVALLLASLAAYGVATAALRPVEAMRRRAAAVSPSAPGARLPLPAARDEVRRLGETLNDMLERLEVAFARERAFVSDASHELRTPLAILKTELELALRAGRSREELADALRSAAVETDRLVQLAEDLLVIARSDHGRLPIRATEVDTRDLLERVADRFRPRAAPGGMTVTVGEVEAERVYADALRIEQALGNMLENALRHGGGEVALSAEKCSGAVEIHVRDRGPGFPDDFLPSAFERFSRADKARGRGGAGLGLAIVAAIAQAHGGDVGVQNGQTGGADVWFTIPGEPPRRPR